MNEQTVDLTANRALETRVSQLEQELVSARSQISRLELQLHVLASTDPMTGLANRNGLIDSIEAAVARHQRMGEPFAVVSFRFPRLSGLEARSNADDYEGSIQHLAALLAAGLRNVDRVARLDDHTFAVVLTNIESSNIPIVVDRTLASVRALPLLVGTTSYELDPVVAALVPGNPSPDAITYVDRLDSVLDGSGGFSVEVLSAD